MISSAAHAEQIRVVNLTSLAGGVDVWIDSSQTRSNLGKNAASSFNAVKPGRHQVTVNYRAGWLANLELYTPVGQQATLALYTDPNGWTRLKAFLEPFAAAPSSGQVRIRTYNLLPSSCAAFTVPALNASSLIPGASAVAFTAKDFANPSYALESVNVPMGRIDKTFDKSASVFLLERAGESGPDVGYQVVVE